MHEYSVEAHDTPAARNQDHMVVGNEMGEKFIYLRDKREYPDGVVRWRWLDDTPIKSIQNGEWATAPGEGATSNYQPQLRPEGDEWALYVYGERIAAVKKSELRTKADADAFVRQFFPDGATFTESKEV